MTRKLKQPETIADQLAEFASVRAIGTPSALGVGIHRDIPSEDYHANPGASNSRLMDLAQSPAHARHRMDNPEDPTPALIIGDATHTIILQGEEEFSRRYVVADRCSARTEKGASCRNGGKYLIGGEWLCGVHARADRFGQVISAMSDLLCARGFSVRHISSEESGSIYFEHENGWHARVSNHAPNPKTLAWMLRVGCENIRVDLPPYGSDDARRVISQDDFDLCQRMHDSVMAHPAARSLIAAAEDKEVSAIWDCSQTGVRCKMRGDLVSTSKGLIADLKTTLDASVKPFMRTIGDRGYHFQGAMYTGGMAALGHAIDDFAIIAVEKDAPHAVAVYRLKDDLFERAHVELMKRLATWKQCEESGVWPAYPEDIQDITLTDWALRELEKL